jgi:hypothetical protein
MNPHRLFSPPRCNLYDSRLGQHGRFAHQAAVGPRRGKGVSAFGAISRSPVVIPELWMDYDCLLPLPCGALGPS